MIKEEKLESPKITFQLFLCLQASSFMLEAP